MLPPARRPGPRARVWERPPSQAQDAQHLRLPSDGLRTPRFGWRRAAAWRREQWRRPKTQVLHPPMNEGPPTHTHPHSSSLALTSRTSAQNNIKWVPVVWYSNISLILSQFLVNITEIEAFPDTCFLSHERRKKKKKDKCLKKKYKNNTLQKNFCSRLNNVHGGLVVFHTSRVHS